MKENSVFSPIDPDFYDIFEPFMQTEVRVVYFVSNQKLEESRGKLKGLIKNDNGEFLDIIADQNVRIDRIITINGKLGPAFDEYDSYANECLSCKAGYDE